MASDSDKPSDSEPDSKAPPDAGQADAPAKPSLFDAGWDGLLGSGENKSAPSLFAPPIAPAGKFAPPVATDRPLFSPPTSTPKNSTVTTAVSGAFGTKPKGAESPPSVPISQPDADTAKLEFEKAKEPEPAKTEEPEPAKVEEPEPAKAEEPAAPRRTGWWSRPKK